VINIIYITTSRKPGKNTRVFAKDFARLINAIYLTRGKSSIANLINTARYNGASDIYIITEKNGNPNQILHIEIVKKYWEFKESFTITLHKLTKTLTETKPKITCLQIATNNKPLRHILKINNIFSEEECEYIIKDVKEAVSLFHKDKEIGPRFEIKYSDYDEHKPKIRS
jgi:rRNA maturation protein Rpf1